MTTTEAIPSPHINLERRKALAARIRIAMRFEQRQLDLAPANLELTEEVEEALHRLEDLHQAMLAGADRLTNDGEKQLDHSLRNLANSDAFKVAGQGPLLDQIRARIEHTQEGLRDVECKKCCKKAICSGDHQDHEIVEKYGNCIFVLKDLAEKTAKLVSDVYLATGEKFAPPQIVLATSHRDQRAYSTILQRHHISGWSQADGPARSLVGLDIQERNFRWAQLCGSFYVLLHEILCHGFQSLDGQERENAKQTCYWSEGWMDRLAYWLGLEWVVSHATELPQDIARDKATLSEMLHDIHGLRYRDDGTMASRHFQRRLYARALFDQIKDAWNFDGPMAKHPITAFSLRLNARTLSSNDRSTVIDTLAALINLVPNMRNVLEPCEAFNRSGDLQALISSFEILKSPHIPTSNGNR